MQVFLVFLDCLLTKISNIDMKPTGCVKKQKAREVYENTVLQLKEIINQIGEKANEQGIVSLKDILSLSKGVRG